MKKVTLLFLTFLIPFYAFNQSIIDYNVDIKGYNHTNIIDIIKNENSRKVFAVANYDCSYSGEKSKKDLKTNFLYVYELIGDELKSNAYYILANESFPDDTKYELKKGQLLLANQDNAISLDQLLKKYPNLSKKNLEKYFTSNETPFYKSEIKTNLYTKIENFSSAKYSMGTEKGSGMIGKLNQLDKKVSGGSNAKTLVASNEVSLDWEKSYNGGQDKKNYWKNIYQISDPQTGNLFVLNNHFSKEDKALEYKAYEFVIFNAEGELISRKELNFEIPWENQQIKPFFIDNEIGSKSLKSLVIVFTQNSKKKINPNPNEAQIKVLNISAQGNILFDQIFDAPSKIKYIDNIAHHDSEHFVIFAAYKGHKYLVECGPNKHFGNSFKLGMMDDSHNLKGYHVGKDYNYVLFDDQLIINNNPPEKPAKQFFVYATKDGEISDRMVIPFEVEAAEAFNGQFSDTNNGKIILMTKLAGKGINKFNFTLTAFSLYELDGKTMKKLNDSAEITYAFAEDNANTTINALESEGSIFFMGGKFEKDKSGTLRWSNKLIKVK